MIVNSSGRNLLKFDPLNLLKNESLLLQTGQSALSLFNGEIKHPEIEVNELNKVYAFDFVQKQNRLVLLGMGEMVAYCFLKYLKPSENPLFNHLLIFFWKQEKLQKSFVEEFCRENQGLLKDRQLFAYEIGAQDFFLPKTNVATPLYSTIADAQQNQFSIYSDLTIDRKKFIAVSYRGNELNRLVFTLMVPYGQIETQMQMLRIRTIMGLLLFLVLIIGSLLLSRKYLLNPLHELKDAINAFSRRDFRFRTRIFSNNELGQLSHAFNITFANLEDLNVAETVQSTLLPQQAIKSGCLHVLIYNRCMSKLGGDCFNICHRDKNTLQIFIGDATGHGVAAALSVAMAKSVLINEEREGFPSANVLIPLNSVFFANRRKKRPDLLTGQVFHVSNTSGEFKFFNAGHTLPLKIAANGESAAFISNSGFPLGLTAKPDYPEASQKIEPGEIILITTDGFIELNDRNGKPIGFEGFKDIALQTWNSDPEKFRTNLLNALLGLGENSEDDQTLILVKNVE
jgi:HAMP domain-containing protein